MRPSESKNSPTESVNFEMSSPMAANGETDTWLNSLGPGNDRNGAAAARGARKQLGEYRERQQRQRQQRHDEVARAPRRIALEQVEEVGRPRRQPAHGRLPHAERVVLGEHVMHGDDLEPCIAQQRAQSRNREMRAMA